VATVNASGTVTLTGVLGTAHILANQPGDANFNPAPQVSQELTVTQVTPVITWTNPAPILVGTALGSTQLNATSGGVDGGFVYAPDSGTILAAGSHTLSAQFTPTNSSLYVTPAAKQVTLIVSPPPWLNVNFDNVTRSGLVGPAGGLGTTWNTIALAAGTTNNLLDASNATTTVGVTIGNGGTSWGAPPLVMLTQGLYVGNGGTGAVTITGLTAGHNYDLFIGCYYYDAGSKARFSTTNATSTVGDQFCDNGGAHGNGSTWVQGANYVAFLNVEPDVNNKITFTYFGNGTYAMVNGLQLVEIDAVTTPYDTWANGTFANGTLSDKDPTHDPDGDGLTNQQEFAYGIDPTTGSSVNPITVPLDKGTGVFKYTRTKDSGLTYVYQSSTTLSDPWDVFTPDAAVSNNAIPVEEITVTVPPLLLNEFKLFLRVKAE
jgi:hypothetical protein